MKLATAFSTQPDTSQTGNGGKANVLAVIPAKSNSNRLPGKNLAPLGGKPLIAWTVEAALNARTITRTAVSTDEPLISNAAMRAAARVEKGIDILMRPKELCADDVPAVDVVLHILEETEPCDFVVMLQPTSPFRRASQIDDAVLMCSQWTTVVSVRQRHGVPYSTLGVGLRRPELEYESNGAIYVTAPERLLENRSFHVGFTKTYPMDELTSIEIDTPLDWVLAEAAIEKGLV